MFWLSPVNNRIASYYAFETGYFGMDDFDSAVAEYDSVDETKDLREHRENRGIFDTDRDFLEPILKKFGLHTNKYLKMLSSSSHVQIDGLQMAQQTSIYSYAVEAQNLIDSGRI